MPSQTDEITQVMSSGIEALSLTYQPVHQFTSPYLLVRTSLNINSLQLGVLTPEQYGPVVQRTSQADRLFRRHLHKLLGEIPGLTSGSTPVRWFSLPACGRMLKNGTLSTVLFEELSGDSGVSASQIFVEISADLLFEDLDTLLPELGRVSDLGVGIVLTEVGDEYAPLLRLGKVPFKWAFLDSYPLSTVNTSEESVLEGLCSFLHVKNCKIIAADLENDLLLRNLEPLGCDGYSLRDAVTDHPDFRQDEEVQPF